MPGPWEKYQQPAQDGPWSKYAQQQVPQPAPSSGSSTKRGIGLGARATLEGVAGVVDLLASPLRAAFELSGSPQETYVGLANRLGDKIGLPRPETSSERISTDIGRSLSGGAVTMGAGGAMAQLPGMIGRVGATLSAQPGLQTISNVTGAGAAGITRESGGSQGAQLAAGLIGGLGPSAVVGGSQAAVRGALRGGEAGRQALA